MFLALLDSGRREDLERVATGLLRMAAKRLPRDPKVVEAQRAWDEGLTDDRGVEVADRAYVVVRQMVEALDRFDQAGWAGGGEVLVCTAIRTVHPLAPPGFAQVGKLEGRPSVPGDSARVEPHRSLLGQSRT